MIKLKSPTINASARIFSIYCRTFILFLFLFEIYHNITFWGKRLFCVLFQVLCTSLFVEVISLTVNDDYKRHVFHIKLLCGRLLSTHPFMTTKNPLPLLRLWDAMPDGSLLPAHWPESSNTTTRF